MEIRKLERGFSLVELIVVITIIMVVTVVGAVNFAGTNKKGRDGRRMADLEKIKIALEMARQVGGTYPAATGGLPSGLTPNYIQALPKDPKGYSYVYNSTNYAFNLYALMEDLGSTNFSGVGPTCSPDISCNYKATNQ